MTVDKRIYEQFNLRAPFKLEDATILVLAMVGSTSHNTYVPKDDPNAIDDVDYMGVVIPPPSYTFGIREWENTAFQFEELDCVFYSFRKFMQLMIKSNPNVLGLTYLLPEHYIAQSKEWAFVLRWKSLFSSLAAYKAFTGYAYAQLKKMTSFDIDIQNEWDYNLGMIQAAGWTKEDVIHKRNRGMPDYEAVNKYIMQDTPPFPTTTTPDQKALIDSFLGQATENILKIHARHFQGYMGDKRKNLVRKHGYDTKNAAHLIRLMRMCNEFLMTGTLQVYRTTDAQEIRDIKSGKWTLEQVQAEAEKLFADAEEAKKLSGLPVDPAYDAVDEMAKHVYLSAYGFMTLPTDEELMDKALSQIVDK